MGTDDRPEAASAMDEKGAERLRVATELVVRIGVLAILAWWCFSIFRPFLIPLVWGIILAVTLYPAHMVAERVTGGRRKLAAILLLFACLGVLLVPTVMLSDSLVEGVKFLSARIDEGKIRIPPAPESIASWPIIGKFVHETWNLAYTDLEAVLQKFHPQLAAVGLWLVGIAKQAVLAVFVTAFALLIAAMLLVWREPAVKAAYGIGARLGGEQGMEYIRLAGRSIGTIAKGVVGVAAIQSILAAAGLMAAGVPGAALWSIVVLILAVAQLPPALVLGPAIGYLALQGASTVTLVLLSVWTIIIVTIDTPLRAIFLGRGSGMPVPVILVGAIGGLLLHGFIGLFVGAVVFSISYRIIVEWARLHPVEEDLPPEAAPEAGSPGPAA